MIMAETLQKISFIVACLVILGMVVVFSTLFWLYGRYKIKLIDYGFEDEYLQKELYKGFEKNKKYSDLGNYFNFKKEKERKIQKVSSALYNILLSFFVLITFIALVFKSNGQQIYFGNTTYLTIQTGSMETKNIFHNEYNQLPNNQIKQYSLIGIQKVKQDELKKMDIIAFKNNKTIYVHRIMNIHKGNNGLTYYTTQGDANTGSMSFEVNMTFDKIIGKFTGYQNFGLGVLLIYLQSNIGIISLVFGLLFVMITNVTENKISISYDGRLGILIGPYLPKVKNIRRRILKRVKEKLDWEEKENRRRIYKRVYISRGDEKK